MIRCKFAESHVAITNEKDPVARPCCQYSYGDETLPYALEANTIQDILNGEHRQKLLNSFNKNIRVDSCRNCWNMEDSNTVSKRTSIANNLDLNKVGKFQHTELGLDFTCNMTCRMCNSATSSSINKLTSMNEKLYKKYFRII